MSYSSILKKLVSESKLTYTEIIEECKKHGTSIDKSYLSKLVNGKISPPSNDVSHAFEKVFNVQTDTLIIEAYFDKAPRQVKSFIKRTRDDIFYSTITDGFFYEEENEELIEEYKAEFDKQPIINYLPTAYNVGNDDNYNYSFYNNNKIDYEIYVNDEGMEPLIPKGTSVTIEGSDSYENGDIVVVKYNLLSEKTLVVRKYFMISDKAIILIPANFKVEPILITDEPYIIMGKVKSYQVDIK